MTQMAEFIRQTINEYGRSVTMYSSKNESGSSFTAYIEPLTPQSTSKLHIRTKAGGVKKEEFLLIAGMDSFPDGAENVRLVCGGLEYDLIRADRCFLGNEASHWEAVLRLHGKVRDDNA